MPCFLPSLETPLESNEELPHFLGGEVLVKCVATATPLFDIEGTRRWYIPEEKVENTTSLSTPAVRLRAHVIEVFARYRRRVRAGSGRSSCSSYDIAESNLED